jgi:hypothetical protein
VCSGFIIYILTGFDDFDNVIVQQASCLSSYTFYSKDFLATQDDMQRKNYSAPRIHINIGRKPTEWLGILILIGGITAARLIIAFALSGWGEPGTVTGRVAGIDCSLCYGGWQRCRVLFV